MKMFSRYTTQHGSTKALLLYYATNFALYLLIHILLVSLTGRTRVLPDGTLDGAWFSGPVNLLLTAAILWSAVFAIRAGWELQRAWIKTKE